MSDIRETLLNFTKNATKSSGDLFKSTKLSMSVSTEQNNLKNLYMEIGKKVHEIYQYGGNLGKFFDEKYREIEACEQRILELKEQIGQIKGTRECPKCGKSAERTAEFCPKCGIRMAAPSEAQPAHVQPVGYDPSAAAAEGVAAPTAGYDPPAAPGSAPHSVPSPVINGLAGVSAPTAEHTPTADTPTAAPPKTTRNCRVCGMENEITAKFCLSCGRIVD